MGSETDHDVYGEEIITYLKVKYNDEFSVASAVREFRYGEKDIVRALCYNNAYPTITFQVQHHLAANNIFGKSEILKLLKEADAYEDGDLMVFPEEVERYFEDDYANILFQNEFDLVFDSMKNKDEYFFMTKFETPNYFPSVEEARVSLEQFMANPNQNLYATHYVFAKNRTAADERAALLNDAVKHIYHADIHDQALIVFFVEPYDISAIKEEYLENYKYPYDYFLKSGKSSFNYNFRIRDGEIENAEELMERMGGE